MSYIDNWFHFYDTTESFEVHRRQGLINPDSICFLKETGQIYTQNSFFGICKERYERFEQLVLEHDAKIKNILGIEGPSIGDGVINNIADLVNFLDGFTDEDNLKDFLEAMKTVLESQISAVNKALSDRITALEGEIHNDSENLHNAINAINSQIETIDIRLDNHDTAISALNTELAAHIREYNLLKTNYDNFKSYAETKFTTIDSSISSINISISTLQQEFIDLDEKFDNVENEVSEVKALLEDAKRLVQEIEDRFGETLAALEQFKRDINAEIDDFKALVGAPDGIAPLDGDAKVPSAYLPSYVDDVLEYATKGAFPTIGESGKIYVALDSNLTYRWSGSTYVEVSKSLGLGETATTAYPGNKGKKNADDIAAHKADTNNPHNVTKAQLGLDRVNNTADADKPVSAAQAAAIKVVQDDLTSHKGNKANPHEVTKAQVGLSNVDNTADLDKPISNSTQASLDVITNSLESHIGDQSNPHNVTKEQIGLGNVDNTSDKDKPISDAAQNLFDTKVDKIIGKGLSTNDFTNEDKVKLDNSMSNRKLTSEEIENLTSKNVGDLVYNTTINKYVYWNGTSWEEVGDTDLSDYVTKAELDTEVDTLSAVINTKVDKISGKSLSTNDFTDELKQRVVNLGKKVGTFSYNFKSLCLDTSVSIVDMLPFSQIEVGDYADVKVPGSSSVIIGTLRVISKALNQSAQGTGSSIDTVTFGGAALDSIIMTSLRKDTMNDDQESLEIFDNRVIYRQGDTTEIGEYSRVDTPTVENTTIYGIDTIANAIAKLEAKFSLIDVIDELSYGVSWRRNHVFPQLNRVGNDKYHETLPIQSGMKGCVYKPKEKKVVYWLDGENWNKREAPISFSYASREAIIGFTEEGNLKMTHGNTVYDIATELVNCSKGMLSLDALSSEGQYIGLYNNDWEDVQYFRVISADSQAIVLEYKGNPSRLPSLDTNFIYIGSNLSGFDGEVMVYVPGFYIKSWDELDRREVRISTIKIDESWEYQPPVFLGAYRDTVLNTVPEDMGYLSTLPANTAVSVANSKAYCRGGNNNAANDADEDIFKRQLGKCRTSISRTTFRTYARNAGKEIMSYRQYKNIMYWLYVIEYANFNSQAPYNAELTVQGFHHGGLGNGLTNVSDWGEYNGYYPISPNGYTNEFGNGTGIKLIEPGGPAPVGSVYATRWRGLENPFGDVWHNVDGIIIDADADNHPNNMNYVYTTDDPLKYGDAVSDIANMVLSGLEVHADGYTKEWDLGTTAEIIPRLMGGNTTQYKCAYHLTGSKNTALRTLLLGSHAGSGGTAGLGHFTSSNGVGNSHVNVGFRTSCAVGA